VQVRRTIGWFSCGAASAIAVKLTGAQPVYCETGAEHPDNARFFADCTVWFGRDVTRLRSREYPAICCRVRDGQNADHFRLR
jgi:hypothetical protein